MRFLLEEGRHDVGDEIDSLLLGPSTDEDEEVGVGILLDSSPFLSESLVLRSKLLSDDVDDDLVDCDGLFVEGGDVGRIGVGEGIDGSKSPESRVSSPRSLSVLVRDSSDSDRVLVNADERSGGVKQVEGVSELDVLRGKGKKRKSQLEKDVSSKRKKKRRRDLPSCKAPSRC